MRPSILLCSILCALCASAVTSTADEGWSLTTADFKRQTVNLRSFDEASVKVIPYNQTDQLTIPLDKLLQIDRGAAVQQVRGAYTLYLVSGDRVGGEPVSIANDTITWKSPAAGQLAIPVKDLRGIVKGQDTPAFDSTRTEDVILLSNGDNVKGIITGLDAGKVSIKQASGDILPVDFADAKAIHFAAAKGENLIGRAFRVQLSDGSVVTAPKVVLAGNQLMLTLGANGAAAQRPVDLAQVVLIEQLNGPVSWLSARVPAEVVYQPMFETAAYSPKMDRNYRDEKIKFAGREYTRGIGVHAYTKITYALDGTFKALRTQYALDESAAKGRVTVRILLDDKVVHEAKDFPPGKLSPVVLLELGSAKTLSLEAHPGGDPNTQDRTQWNPDTQARLNWIEPALLKEIPAPEAPKPVSPKLDVPTPEPKPDIDSPKPADLDKPKIDAPKLPDVSPLPK
jgi:hypothetical protein